MAGLVEKHIIKTSLEKVRNNPLTGKSDALYHSKRFYKRHLVCQMAAFVVNLGYLQPFYRFSR